MIDYIIKNGWIINGKRQKPFHGDISIKDGKIEEMKEHIEIPADFPDEKILDAQDGYVTPGFIDIHRHGDWQALHHGDDELLNRQGLTTVVNGNCGLSVAPAGKKHRRNLQFPWQCNRKNGWKSTFCHGFNGKLSGCFVKDQPKCKYRNADRKRNHTCVC